MTQRDDMGREVGGGFRTGNSCTPVADSCQCMTKQKKRKGLQIQLMLPINFPNPVFISWFPLANMCILCFSVFIAIIHSITLHIHTIYINGIQNTQCSADCFYYNMILRFINISTPRPSSFIPIAQQYSIVWLQHSIFVYSHHNEPLGCFQFCAIINMLQKKHLCINHLYTCGRQFQ